MFSDGVVEEDGNSETLQTSFRNVVMSQSQSQGTETEESSSMELDENEEGSEFRLRRRSVMRRRRRRHETKLAERSGPCPSLFHNEIRPLKIPPTYAEYGKWERKGGISDLHSVPISLNHFRPEKRDLGARRKVIQEMLLMKASLDSALARCTISKERPQVKPKPKSPAPPPVEVSRTKPEVAESDTDEDEVPGPPKPFGFGRIGLGSQKDDDSVSEDEDKDSIAASPFSQPVDGESPAPNAPNSQGSTGSGRSNPSLTPKSSIRNVRKVQKRRRLTWGGESDSSQPSPDPEDGKRERKYPKLRLNDSELDSLSFTSHSPAHPLGPPDLDSSNFQNAKALHEVPLSLSSHY